MAIPPRIILFSAIGIILYLGLSLYHGHQLKKYPLLERNGGKVLSGSRSEEKNWVQVSTSKQVAAGPVQPHGAPGQLNGASNDAPAGIAGGRGQSASHQEQQHTAETEAAAEDPQVLLAALQTELLHLRAFVQNREEKLQQASMQREKMREEKQQAVENARTLREELAPIRKEQSLQMAEINRLQIDLKEARARAAIAEGELERARLKADAMFRYGQEQNRLLAPSRQEVDILKTRLQETSGKLLAAEQQVTDLNKREKQLRRELHALRSAGDGEESTAAPAGEGKGPTTAGAGAD
ncbi:MAG TPA: hypothetical protein DDY20_03395 [Desulfobulbaceae bacterium]|nr:hypothetical protein [Desulfobulbaceae bacterium]